MWNRLQFNKCVFPCLHGVRGTHLKSNQFNTHCMFLETDVQCLAS